jgi:hypothetical protein
MGSRFQDSGHGKAPSHKSLGAHRSRQPGNQAATELSEDSGRTAAKRASERY